MLTYQVVKNFKSYFFDENIENFRYLSKKYNPFFIEVFNKVLYDNTDEISSVIAESLLSKYLPTVLTIDENNIYTYYLFKKNTQLSSIAYDKNIVASAINKILTDASNYANFIDLLTAALLSNEKLERNVTSLFILFDQLNFVNLINKSPMYLIKFSCFSNLDLTTTDISPAGSFSIEVISEEPFLIKKNDIINVNSNEYIVDYVNYVDEKNAIIYVTEQLKSNVYIDDVIEVKTRYRKSKIFKNDMSTYSSICKIINFGDYKYKEPDVYLNLVKNIENTNVDGIKITIDYKSPKNEYSYEEVDYLELNSLNVYISKKFNSVDSLIAFNIEGVRDVDLDELVSSNYLSLDEILGRASLNFELELSLNTTYSNFNSDYIENIFLAKEIFIFNEDLEQIKIVLDEFSIDENNPNIVSLRFNKNNVSFIHNDLYFQSTIFMSDDKKHLVFLAFGTNYDYPEKMKLSIGQYGF